MCEHLVIVAGLPCSGKSSLVEQLQTNGARHVATVIRVSPAAQVRYARRTTPGELAGAGEVLLHFDMYAQRQGGEQLLHGLMARAKRTTLVTAHTNAGELRRRHRQRAGSFLRSLTGREVWRSGHVWQRMRRHADLLALYRRADAVQRIYEQWARFAQAAGLPHYIVDCSDRELRITAAATSPPTAGGITASAIR